MPQKLTVLIPCKNEAHNIRDVHRVGPGSGRRDSRGRLAVDRQYAGAGPPTGRLPHHPTRVRRLRQLQELGHPPGQPSLGAGVGCRRAGDRAAGGRNPPGPGPRRAVVGRLPPAARQLFSRPSDPTLRLEPFADRPAVSPRPMPLRRRQGPRAIGRVARQGGHAPRQIAPLHVLVSGPMDREAQSATPPSGPRTATPPAAGQVGWESSPDPRCDSSSSTSSEPVFSMGPRA